MKNDRNNFLSGNQSFLFRVRTYLLEKKRKRPGFWITCTVIFFFLAVLHCSYLAEPPFWDEIFGLHNQSIWLARHRFCFWELCSADELYWNGGSWIYPVSFMPWIIGIFYALFPPGVVHVLCRLLSLFSASVCIACFLEICRILKIRVLLAFLTATLFASFPFFMGQSVSAGQEVIVAALMMVSLLFFMKDRFSVAILFAFLAGLVKQTAMILPFSYFLYFAGWMIFAKKFKYKEEILLSILCFVFSPVLIRIIPTSIVLGTEISLTKTLSMIQLHYTYFFRDFFHVCAAAVLFFVISFLNKKTSLKKIDPRLSVFLMSVVFFFAGYFLQNKMAHCPRYAAIAVFPAAVLFVFLISRCNFRISCIFLSLAILLNLCNQNGQLLLNIPKMSLGDGSYFERSKEYFQVIKIQKKMCREIELEKGTVQYICTWPYPQILTIPELGYVSKPVKGILSGRIFPKYAKAQHLNEYDPQKPVHFLADYPVHPPFWSESFSPEKFVGRKAFYAEHIPLCSVVIYDMGNIEEDLKKIKNRSFDQ